MKYSNEILTGTYGVLSGTFLDGLQDAVWTRQRATMNRRADDAGREDGWPAPERDLSQLGYVRVDGGASWLKVIVTIHVARVRHQTTAYTKNWKRFASRTVNPGQRYMKIMYVWIEDKSGRRSFRVDKRRVT
jgi:hypothetical protein